MRFMDRRGCQRQYWKLGNKCILHFYCLQKIILYFYFDGHLFQSSVMVFCIEIGFRPLQVVKESVDMAKNCMFLLFTILLEYTNSTLEIW